MSIPNPTVQKIRQAIETVRDPDVGRNIVELGLIYDVLYYKDKKKAHVKMTLTSQWCPHGTMLVEQTRYAANTVEEVEETEVELVWTPPWNPYTMLSDELKLELGFL